jgi:chromosome segregation ATPase
MSFEESPWEREDREIHEAFRAKDAEIDRLRVWCNEALDQRDKSAAEIERLLTKNEKEKNLLLTVLDKQTTEIERLKAEYLKLDERLEQALRKNENQATLITELADAINKWRVEPDQLSIMRRLYSPEIVSLLQRARESTNGR